MPGLNECGYKALHTFGTVSEEQNLLSLIILAILVYSQPNSRVWAALGTHTFLFSLFQFSALACLKHS